MSILTEKFNDSELKTWVFNSAKKLRKFNIIGISGQKIIWVVSIGFAIYRYGKMIVKFYKYGQQILSQRKKNSQLTPEQGIYIIIFLVRIISLFTKKVKVN